jgi:hypothetical protein
VPNNQTFTSTEETPHGVVPPQSGLEPSYANVWWQGSRVIPNHGTITFGFDHPNEPWDHEWFAIGDEPNQFTVGQVDSPIAGPTGVFTDGWVHAPGPEPGQSYCGHTMENCSNWVPPAVGTGCAAYVVAQSFMPQEDYVLCRVDVVLQYVDWVTLYVQDDPSDTPGTIYGQATQRTTGSERWYQFEIPDVEVFAGTTYYIRVVGDVSWKEKDTDPYPRGMAYENETPLSYRDHFFKTFTHLTATSVEPERPTKSTRFVLEQNYPDPFSSMTEIRYHLTETCPVRLEVYNVAGQRVATLVDETQAAGTKVTRWTAGADLPGGTYFCTLKAGSFADTRKMILLR